MDAPQHVAPGIEVLALRTPTLPPATHTNTYLVGSGEVWVFDPASPYEDERQRLAGELLARLDDGETIGGLVLTHHHHDHVAGAAALQATLRQEAGVDVPIVAHPLTDERVDLHVASHWHHGEVRELGGRRLMAHFTPGHAPGHLVFRDVDSGATIAGDLVAGTGTILIDPSEGHLGTYLASLESMQHAGATQLLPSHGPMLVQGQAVLAFYIAHRHQRSQQLLDALDQQGRATALELVPLVYRDQVPESFWPVAARQLLAHLIWLQEHGQAHADGETWSRR